MLFDPMLTIKSYPIYKLSEGLRRHHARKPEWSETRERRITKACQQFCVYSNAICPRKLGHLQN